MHSQSYFSISAGLLYPCSKLEFDLFVQSSKIEKVEKFVRIFSQNEALHQKFIQKVLYKYNQIYIAEEDRQKYLSYLVKDSKISDQDKATVIKDSAIKYLSDIFEKDFSSEVLEETLVQCRDSVEHLVKVIHQYTIEDIQKLIAGLSFHDFYTFDHSINVSMYCIALYKALRPFATDEQLIMVGMGGLLHDIGKIKIPTRIINKPDKLNEEEFALIKTHPEEGRKLLIEHHCQIEGVDFKMIENIVYEHHENYNGTGYPRGLKKKEIGLYARITAIADFFDALTTQRAYHKVMSPVEALAIMEKSVGKKIDPDIFHVFEKSILEKKVKSLQVEELPDSFDPCSPHNVLPFIQRPSPKVIEELQSQEIKKEKLEKIIQKDFGQVQFDQGFAKRDSVQKKKAS